MPQGFRALVLVLLLAFVCAAQTTQGLISGRVVDARTGRGIANCDIIYSSTAGVLGGTARTDTGGYFILPLLSPGVYRLRVAIDKYQPQEVQEVDLPVAGRRDFYFRLRPLNDVWEAGQYRSVFLPGSEAVLNFYGPDVDTSRSGSFEAARGSRNTLETSLSEVIDQRQIRDLPFNGRDVYTMLVTQPGVTADTTTARGLGLAALGQRPSASNFLLDGIENNNYLVTGPATVVAPEAIQEYRVSTGNFSAEYGRTSGFLANAVSRSGGDQWHGVGYYYLKNEVLNANGFQQNLAGLPRAPVKEAQPGIFVGGPLRARTLFASASLEYYRFRSRGDRETIFLPSTTFSQITAANSVARRLLQQYAPPPVSDGNQVIAPLDINQPSSVNRLLALPRVDWVRSGGRDRVFARAIVSRFHRPDFLWTPYKDFVTPLDNNALGLGGSWIRSLPGGSTNEARLGWTRDDLVFDRPHPEIPTLSSGDGALLPGSPSFYGYRNNGRSIELADNLLVARGRHVFKIGGGALLRRLEGYLTAGRDGLFGFPTVVDFAADLPAVFFIAVDRADPARRTIPRYDREYRYAQYFAFAQDSFRVTPRLVVNLGLRYESFGAPRNTGEVKDTMVALGSGASMGERLAGARVVFPAAGDQMLYDADRNDFGVRTGFAYNLRADSRTVLRGAYGVFYDRPFENLWQNLRNNNASLAFVPLSRPVDYLQPVARQLTAADSLVVSNDTPRLTFYQPGMRNAYVHNYFLGVQHQVTGSLTLELSGLGSLGRKLITTDAVNRPLSTSRSTANPLGYFNPVLPSLSYRANQGISNYHGLAITGRYRATHGLLHAAYTWSHAFDNQSEPLDPDVFALDFTRITAGQGRSTRAAFTRQFDSAGDRASSDFDQRHNFVLFSIWDLPPAFRATRLAPLFRDWKIAQLAAVRSGFPYSVTVPIVVRGTEQILNNRADVVDPARSRIDQPVPGGRRLLDARAFSVPVDGRLGTLGRNAFHGPGLYNVDLSVSRAIPLRRLGEAARLTVRADAFNVLNHVNLQNPDALFSPDPDDPTALVGFGVARYGRQGRDTGFPAVVPFNETARQVQILLRLEF